MIRLLRGIRYHGMAQILSKEPEFSLHNMTSSFDDPAQISSPQYEDLVAWIVGTRDMAKGFQKANELLVFCLMEVSLD